MAEIGLVGPSASITGEFGGEFGPWRTIMSWVAPPRGPRLPTLTVQSPLTCGALRHGPQLGTVGVGPWRARELSWEAGALTSPVGQLMCHSSASNWHSRTVVASRTGNRALQGATSSRGARKSVPAHRTFVQRGQVDGVSEGTSRARTSVGTDCASWTKVSHDTISVGIRFHPFVRAGITRLAIQAVNSVLCSQTGLVGARWTLGGYC